MTTTIGRQIPLLTLCVALAACDGGSDAPQTAPLTLRVTDAPVDPGTIERVCVQFSAVTVHYASDSEVQLAYAPLPAQVSSTTHCLNGSSWSGQGTPPPVRLSALGGALTVALADSLQVPVGRVTWIRLHFVPDGSFLVENAGGQHDLRCPSCEVTDNNQGRGFKLNRSFEVTSSGIAVTVDVDLSKSLHRDGSGYVLRPTARLELDNTIGTIAGTVADTAITALGGDLYAGPTIETGCAVYVYAGAAATPVDLGDRAPNAVTAARVRFDVASTAYRFAAGALPDDEVGGPEWYTVALTCSLDDPAVDQPVMDQPDTAVVFGAPQNVGVDAGATVLVNF